MQSPMRSAVTWTRPLPTTNYGGRSTEAGGVRIRGTGVVERRAVAGLGRRKTTRGRAEPGADAELPACEPVATGRPQRDRRAVVPSRGRRIAPDRSADAAGHGRALAGGEATVAAP